MDVKNMKAQHWIEETLKGTTHITRAEASPFLLTRIRARMESATETLVKPSRVALIMASLVVLALLNISLLRNTSKRSVTKRDGLENIINEYSLNSSEGVFSN